MNNYKRVPVEPKLSLVKDAIQFSPRSSSVVHTPGLSRADEFDFLCEKMRAQSDAVKAVAARYRDTKMDLMNVFDECNRPQLIEIEPEFKHFEKRVRFMQDQLSPIMSDVMVRKKKLSWCLKREKAIFGGNALGGYSPNAHTYRIIYTVETKCHHNLYVKDIDFRNDAPSVKTLACVPFKAGYPPLKIAAAPDSPNPENGHRNSRATALLVSLYNSRLIHADLADPRLKRLEPGGLCESLKIRNLAFGACILDSEFRHCEVATLLADSTISIYDVESDKNSFTAKLKECPDSASWARIGNLAFCGDDGLLVHFNDRNVYRVDRREAAGARFKGSLAFSVADKVSRLRKSDLFENSVHLSGLDKIYSFDLRKTDAPVYSFFHKQKARMTILEETAFSYEDGNGEAREAKYIFAASSDKEAKLLACRYDSNGVYNERGLVYPYCYVPRYIPRNLDRVTKQWRTPPKLYSLSGLKLFFPHKLIRSPKHEKSSLIKAENHFSDASENSFYTFEKSEYGDVCLSQLTIGCDDRLIDCRGGLYPRQFFSDMSQNLEKRKNGKDFDIQKIQSHAVKEKKIDFNNLFLVATGENNCKKYFPRCFKFFVESADKRYTADGIKPFTPKNGVDSAEDCLRAMVKRFLEFKDVFSAYFSAPKALRQIILVLKENQVFDDSTPNQQICSVFNKLCEKNSPFPLNCSFYPLTPILYLGVKKYDHLCDCLKKVTCADCVPCDNSMCELLFSKMFFSDSFLVSSAPNEGQTADRLVPSAVENVDDLFLSDQDENGQSSDDVVKPEPTGAKKLPQPSKRGRPAPSDEAPAEKDRGLDYFGDGQALVESMINDWASE